MRCASRTASGIVVVGGPGPITAATRALARRLGRADIGIIAYQPHPVAEHQVTDTWPLVSFFHPRLICPASRCQVSALGSISASSRCSQRSGNDQSDTKPPRRSIAGRICVATRAPQRGKEW